MPEEKKLFCPQCKEWYPVNHFACLPLDLRCNRCIPQQTAAILYDQRKEQAGHAVAQILDAQDHVKGLKPLERMVSQAYDAWGGPGAFMEDVVSWIKDLAGQGRGKGLAVNACMKLLALHAKVDRMKLDEDFKHMDDETLRASLKLKLAALLAETAEDEAKKQAVKRIMGND